MILFGTVLVDELTYEIGPVVEIAPYAMPGSQEFIANISAKLHNNCYCYISCKIMVPCVWVQTWNRH